MSDSKPHSDRSDFDLVRAGLKEAPPHDHDHLAWNALERIEEQLDTACQLLREWRVASGDALPWYDGGHNADLKQRTSALLDPNPASEPDCPTCDGIGAQAGAHTERVEPCPTCTGSGKA